jgi:CspA family cold shock protein
MILLSRHAVLCRAIEPQFWSAFVPQGKIKKIVSDRGFGFIETDRGQDLFFHHSEVKSGSFDHLQAGDRVEYTEGSGKKGPCATDVRPVK